VKSRTAKRRLAQGRERVGWWVGLFVCWLLVGLATTACSIIQPAPTLIPTLTYTPTPSLVPSSVSTTVLPVNSPSPTPAAVRPTKTPFATNFPAWRTATIENHQSFDFRQETVGALTEGDLYYVASSSLQGSACFWANNGKQIGGRDLGSGPLTALTERPLPRDRYSDQCIPVIRGHVYVYEISGDERLAVLRVVDTGPSWVSFEYILRK
jgi:hypothetical protein